MQAWKREIKRIILDRLPYSPNKNRLDVRVTGDTFVIHDYISGATTKRMSYNSPKKIILRALTEAINKRKSKGRQQSC